MIVPGINECHEPNFETDSLRERMEDTDGQLAQLEYAIDFIEKALSPILKQNTTISGECKSVGQKVSNRSPLAEQAHNQGARIYQAHRKLHEIEARLGL